MTSRARGAGRRSSLRIGLTGPIGCGKSTIAAWLSSRGATVIDADEVARAVSAPGSAVHAAILAAFGPDVAGMDGVLDRPALARIVFSSPERLAELETLVHPAVRPEIVRWLSAADAAQTGIVVIEAIRLVEGGLAALCDEVWLVTCDPAAQRSRLAGRDLPPGEADRRIAAQAGLVETIRPHATRVIDSSGSLAETIARVAAALEAALAGRA